MRNIGVVSFAITAGIVIPAVALRLDAGPQQREMLFAPAADSLEVLGVTVHATLDRKLFDQGDTARLSLRAEARVAVGIVVLGSSGTEDERVPGPPRAIVHDTVTIDAHTTKIVELRMTGAKARYTGFGDYAIYVMSPKAADRLAALQRRSGPPILASPQDEIPEPDRDTQKLFALTSNIGSDKLDTQRDTALFGRGKVALYHAYTRPNNPAIKIAAPDTAVVDKPIPITVTLTNPAKHPVTLKIALQFPQFDDSYLGVADWQVKGETSDVIVLDKGETKQIELHVTATQPGVIGVQANPRCEDGGGDCQRFRNGAFEAIQVTTARPIETAFAK